MNKWNLELIYKNIDEWKKDLKDIQETAKKYETFKGTLNSLENILKYFDFEDEVSKKLEKLYVYASMNYDKNQKDTTSQDYYGQIYSTYNNIVAASSFASSELLANGKEKFDKWLKESRKMQEQAYAIDKLFHNQKFIFDEKIEYIMANYSQALGNNNRLYDQLAVADNDSTELVLSTGEKIIVNESNFRNYLETLANQEDRKIVFEAVFKFYAKHKNTFAGIYNGIIQGNIARVKNRNYENSLHSFLYSNNIPQDVFLSLTNTVKENTNVLKKYLDLRKKYFKIDKLHTYDRFLQFTKTDQKYSYEECKEMFFDSCKKISPDFLEHAKKALEEGRVDVHTNDGKRTGAYSTSTYENGPFILLNHNDNMNDAFTVVHEAGHSMHTLYSSENQPYATSNYVIFVAEIASTFNEQLLLDYFMENCKDDNVKLALLQSSIDGLIGTFYRQTLFADYEYQAHSKAEAGETITANVLSNIMKDLYLKYYGIDLNEEQYKEFVWAYIPHFFHSPFYVYQYATSFSASLQIYDDVKNKKPDALDNYVNLLKSGGNDYPVNIVKKAGVDLTSKEPFLAVVKRLEYLVNELENILK